jgi:hypothetical protein
LTPEVGWPFYLDRAELSDWSVKMRYVLTVKTRNILIAAVAALALTVVGALPASAAATIQSFGEGGYPQISADPATGTSLIVYEQNESAIYGVIVDKSMNVVVSPFLLSDDPSEVAFSQPYAGWDANTHSWLVAWDNDSDIYGRIVSEASGPQGAAAVVLASYTQGDPTQTFSDIEQTEVSYSASAQEFLVGFKASSDPQGCQEVFGVLVDATGQPKDSSASTLSSAIPGNDDGTPGCDVTADNGLGLDYSTSAHAWFVGWYDEQNDLTVGRTVTVSGNDPVGASATTTFGDNNSGGAPSIVYDPVRDRFLALWWTTTGTMTVTMANYATDAGVADPATAFALTTGVPALKRATAAYDPATDTFVVMVHNNNLPTQVWQQELSPTSSSPIAFAAVAPGQRPSITASAAGCVLSVWQTTSASPTGTDVNGTAACPVAPASVTLPETGVSPAPGLSLAAAFVVLGIGALSIASAARRRRRPRVG